jgi:uncharacterized protein YegP (UPF0339 family)
MYTLKGYQDSVGDWRWSLVSRNGKPVAESGEAYSKVGNLRRSMNAFKRILNVKVKIYVADPNHLAAPAPAPRKRGWFD